MIKLDRCPQAYAGDWSRWVVRTATLIEKGADPFGIPLADWPDRLHAAVVLALSEKGRIDREAIDRANSR